MFLIVFILFCFELGIAGLLRSQCYYGYPYYQKCKNLQDIEYHCPNKTVCEIGCRIWEGFKAELNETSIYSFELQLTQMNGYSNLFADQGPLKIVKCTQCKVGFCESE